MNRLDLSCPERLAGGEALRPMLRGAVGAGAGAGAGGVPGRSSAEPGAARPQLRLHPHGRSPPPGGASRLSLPCMPFRPVPPNASLPARSPGLRCRRATHQTSTGGGGAAEETLGAGWAETPQFIPPEGQRGPGPRRAGAATFSLFGRLRATERPRSHEWSRASPGQRGRPAHVRQARGSAAPAAAWPNREPSAAPGGQRRREGAGKGSGKSREAVARLGPRGQHLPVPDQVRSLKLVMLGHGGGCE